MANPRAVDLEQTALVLGATRMAPVPIDWAVRPREGTSWETEGGADQ